MTAAAPQDSQPPQAARRVSLVYLLHFDRVYAPYPVLPVIQGEQVGVIGVEHVHMLKSPARRSRAGLGGDGVAGMVSLSR